MVITPIKSRGQIAPIMRSLRIQHPFVREVFSICDLLRDQKLNSEAMDEQSGATLFAPSFSGKSTAIKMYLETVIVEECYKRGLILRSVPRKLALKAQRLVIYISLPPNAHMGSLMHALLKALGDLNPASGTIDERRDRAYTLMENLGVELLIFDEIDHLRTPPPINRANREIATSAHNQLKLFMQDGWPVLFVGIPEARVKLFEEAQVKNREMYNISFDELDMKEAGDVAIYREFCTNLGIALYEKGVTRDIFVFGKRNVYVPLAEASGNLFGVTSKLVQSALE